MKENAVTIGDTLAELILAELAGRNEIEQRIIANRIIAVVETWVRPRVQSPADLIPMTDQEALVFEASVMEFGKYSGQAVCNVPWDYLEWLADASRKTWRQIHQYLNSPRVKRVRESTEGEEVPHE